MLTKKSALMVPFLAGMGFTGLAQAEEAATAAELKELRSQVEALAAALEEKGGSASSENKVSLGGYGEHHLNQLSGNDKDQIDAHRFVLYMGYDYAEDLKFFSEWELEHSLAGDGKPGEVELEQAYIEKTLESGDRVTMGLFLVPVGFLNETHEPDTFYGVERNPVEKNIIPTTWWETGAMYSSTLEHFSYDVALHSSLKAVDEIDHDDDSSTADVTGFKGIRSGRQKSAEADANEPAVTVRLKTQIVDGLDTSLTLQHQSDLSGGAELGIDANLVALTAFYQLDKFSVKALYAKWDINDDIEDLAKGTGANEQEGYTLELAYKVTDTVGVFTRYDEWDKNAGDSAESSVDQINIGANWWLHEQVALKADYQQQTDNSDDSELNGVNLGIGWSY